MSNRGRKRSVELSQSIADLRDVLLNISANPCPETASPPGCPKRASVALIIRLHPHYRNWPKHEISWQSDQKDESARGQRAHSLRQFFELPWVQTADPEILFIKRAARTSDRWNNHVALPGGQRDPEDKDDLETSTREADEEVGLSLDERNAIYVGNLPGRVVTASWGKVPLMVLNPFVFVLTRPTHPPLRLQPSEVASAHWVPISALLSSSLRTYERVEVADRLARRGGPLVRKLLRAFLGQMLFAAVCLIPSETLYSSIGYHHRLNCAKKQMRKSFQLSPYTESADPKARLLLWGLTLGIIGDFLQLLPPHNALKLWTYPNFTPLDARFVVWAVTYKFRKRKQHSLSMVEGHTTLNVEKSSKNEGPTKSTHGSMEYVVPTVSAVGIMLDGYYDLVRRAMFVLLLLRVVFTIVIVAITWAFLGKQISQMRLAMALRYH